MPDDITLRDAEPTTRDLTAPTHGDIIAAGRVNGTGVYGRNEEKIGTIADTMLDKRSGKVVYAVLTVGTFLGLGGKHYPLPWSMLRYNTRLGGYSVDLDRERLENAPSYADNDTIDYAARGGQVHDYWKVPPYWAM